MTDCDGEAVIDRRGENLISFTDRQREGRRGGVTG